MDFASELKMSPPFVDDNLWHVRRRRGESGNEDEETFHNECTREDNILQVSIVDALDESDVNERCIWVCQTAPGLVRGFKRLYGADIPAPDEAATRLEHSQTVCRLQPNRAGENGAVIDGFRLVVTSECKPTPRLPVCTDSPVHFAAFVEALSAAARNRLLPERMREGPRAQLYEHLRGRLHEERL